MLKWYGYLGLSLIILSEINFSAKIEPFASWYLPIVWLGYILFVDSIVFMIRKSSLISAYPKEIVFLALVSIPFWLIFEFYNIFTLSWIYINYIWQIHLVDFATIMPAVLETFSLVSAIGFAKGLDKDKRAHAPRTDPARPLVWLLVPAGAVVALIPLISPSWGYALMWFGIFLFLDPLNYLIGRPSVIKKVASGQKSLVPRLFLSGIIMGFFWEFWNYQAVPHWVYTLPISFGPKIFQMPLFGYLGYLPFAMEVFVFFGLLRPLFFKKPNAELSM